LYELNFYLQASFCIFYNFRWQNRPILKANLDHLSAPIMQITSMCSLQVSDIDWEGVEAIPPSYPLSRRGGGGGGMVGQATSQEKDVVDGWEDGLLYMRILSPKFYSITTFQETAEYPI
jgi:hypothetical protein